MNRNGLSSGPRCALLTAICGLWLLGCTATSPPKLSGGHLQAAPPAEDEIPPAVVQAPILPPPAPAAEAETYTVVVNEVPVKDLLFELARDAKLNVDIHPGVQGVVTLNAIDQTLPQILDRISKQADLRYELDGPNLILSPDIPYWRTYPVNYVNMARDSVGEVSVATQIATTGGTVADGGSNSETGNVSATRVTNNSSNHFWETMEANIRGIIGAASGETDTPDENDPQVIVNRLSGIVSVRAGHRGHRQVQHFLDRVLASALRQVLIEMTIVEVELSDRYQAGVDWQTLAGSGGFSLISAFTGSNLATAAAPLFSLGYADTYSGGRTLSSTLRMLETFGDVKVLSSPKVMALNNQTALLKVVDERVYFTVEREVTDATDTTPMRETFTSEIHTVPVGLVMSVTPQIDDGENVALNIRPTISRITGYATDPAPRLAGASFDNLIPEIQVREMESLLKVSNGQMVVMGGLMQNRMDNSQQGVPVVSSIPLVGDIFSYRDDDYTKTELVIFLRPTVVKGDGLDFDLEPYHDYLPDAERWSAKRNAAAEWLRSVGSEP